nr:hypothetical protein [Tanacetum cinerariifolium]
MILESVEHGPLIWPTVEENGVIRTKKYAELSTAEKIQADCDMKATNIILQGLLADIYSLVNHHRMTPPHFNTYQSSYNNPQLQQQFSPSQQGSILPNQHYSSYYPLQTQFNHSSIQPSHSFQSHMNYQTSTIPQVAYQLPQAPTQLMTESPFVDSGFAIHVFSLGDGLIACLNKAMAFLTAVASLRFPSTNNNLRTSSNTRNQATIQDGKVTVQQVQGRQGKNYFGTTYKGNATSLRGNTTSGQTRVVKCYNYHGERHMARQCTQPKRQRNAAWYKEKAMLAEAQKRIKSTLYDGIVISEKHVDMSVIYNQETLILEEETRSKMSEKAKDPEVIAKKISHKPIDYKKLNRLTDDFGKRFTPQQELSAEQAFWLRISNPTIESSLPPVRVEVPRELPKRSESCAKCLNLDVEFSKSKQAYNDLLKKYSQLNKHCISLKVSMQLKQEMFQNDESCVYQNAPEIPKYFEKNDLKAQLKEKDTTIYSGFVVPVFSLGDDLIACLNKAMTFLIAVAYSRVTVQQVQERQGKNYSGTTYKGNATSSRGNTTSGQERVVKCYNCQGEGHMARQCTQPKLPTNAAWYKEKAMLAEAQEAGKILNEEQLTFLADP